MVRFRDETDTTTEFQFGDKASGKVLENGSLSPDFDINVKRNPRLGAKDILHKKGIRNRLFKMVVILSGASRDINEETLRDLAEAQTTIYLDTEGIKDDYNGKYDFIGKYRTDTDEAFQTVIVEFKLIENVN